MKIPAFKTSSRIRSVLPRISNGVKNKGVALVEIVVSMIILAVAALAVTATVTMVNSAQHRSAGGSSLDLQALSFAKATLDGLKNVVDASDFAGNLGDLSIGDHDMSAGLPAGFQRKYTVSTVAGTDLKKVDLCVAWTPDVCP